MAKGIPLGDNKKHIKGDSRNIYREKPDFSWVEVEAPGAIEGEDGTPIDATVMVPDTKYAYGDDESVALMAGDVVARKSPDPDAGVKAYEASRKQLAQDQRKRRMQARYTKMRSQVPTAALKVLQPGRWELTYTVIDPETGLHTMKRKELTDDEAGGLYENALQNMPEAQVEDGTGWYVPRKAF
jgi:hypothetical protein